MTVPPGTKHQITTMFAGLLAFNEIATLPLNGLKFAKVLNGIGPWSGSLSVEDENVRKTAWINATAPNLTSMWVDIDGVLLYGGRTLHRPYKLSSPKVELSGTDFCGYFAQRLQARDYTAYDDPEGRAWATTGAPVLRMAYYVLSETLSKRFSIPIKVVAEGEEAGSAFWITFSAPATQQQTVASLLSQFQELGYLVGIDYAQDVAWVNGAPTVTVTLSYPLRGLAETDPVVVDLSHALELEYDEDGTEQADRIVEQAGATRVRTKGEVWAPAQEAGYPLLEAQVSHTALAPTEDSLAALKAYLSGSLTTRAFPLVAPVVTLPMFGTPSIFDLDVGQEVVLYAPKGEGQLPPNIPRFPNGLRERFRIVRIDCEVPDEGVPVMVLTLNVMAYSTPVEPPETELKEPASPEEEARKIEVLKKVKEETVAEKEAVSTEEEAAKQKAEEEELARKEAEALAAQEAANKAAALEAGLTPGEVAKMTAQELAERNAKGYTGGPLGDVKKKAEHTEAVAQNAREKAEAAQNAGGGALEVEKEQVNEPALATPHEVSATKLALVTLEIRVKANYAFEEEIVVKVGSKRVGAVGIYVETKGETVYNSVTTGCVSFFLPPGQTWEAVLESLGAGKVVKATYWIIG